MKNKLSIKAVVTLTVICLVTALTLGFVNYLTEPRIEKNEKEKERKALMQVMPTGTDFDSIEVEDLGLDKRVVAVFKEISGEGYVFKLEVKGYKSGMVIMCGIGSDGKVDGAVCLSSSETLGHEKTFGARFKDVDSSSVGSVDTISGATKTTSAYREAVKLALEAFKIMESREEAVS